jgi:hypothetical protein
MTTFKLYGIWERVLAQWLPDIRYTRRANLIWLIVGLYLSEKVQMSAIVKKWPIAVKVDSLTRRLSRFLDNPALRPAVWYRPVARQLLARSVGQTVTLIMDGTKISAGHQLIMVALAHKKRALPVAWTWVPFVRGTVSAATQIALLKRVQGLLPDGARVILVGDSGFASIALLRQLEAWHWGYALRQIGRYLFQRSEQADWARLDTLVTAAGQRVWIAAARFTLKQQHPTALLAYWAADEPKPWLLTTNLPSAYAARQAYARRMWIEEMFGDWKGHGWDVETTHLRDPDRLSRLILALSLLYIWLVFYGARLIKAGLRNWVDRNDRRDLSLFRIGLDTLQRCFTLCRLSLIPLPSLVGGPSVR